MARVTADDWIEEGLAVLGQQGIEAVRVEPVAKLLGVTKGSFYWHFETREAWHRAMLARWRLVNTDRVIEAVDLQGGTLAERIQRLDALSGTAADNELEFAIRVWARQVPWVRTAIHDVDERRLEYLQSLLRKDSRSQTEIAGRAFLIYAALVGYSFIGSSRSDHRTPEVREWLKGLLRD